jgi:hypothetical protein
VNAAEIVPRSYCSVKRITLQKPCSVILEIGGVGYVVAVKCEKFVAGAAALIHVRGQAQVPEAAKLFDFMAFQNLLTQGRVDELDLNRGRYSAWASPSRLCATWEGTSRAGIPNITSNPTRAANKTFFAAIFYLLDLVLCHGRKRISPVARSGRLPGRRKILLKTSRFFLYL